MEKIEVIYDSGAVGIKGTVLTTKVVAEGNQVIDGDFIDLKAEHAERHRKGKEVFWGQSLSPGRKEASPKMRESPNSKGRSSANFWRKPH